MRRRTGLVGQGVCATAATTAKVAINKPVESARAKCIALLQPTREIAHDEPSTSGAAMRGETAKLPHTGSGAFVFPMPRRRCSIHGKYS